MRISSAGVSPYGLCEPIDAVIITYSARLVNCFLKFFLRQPPTGLCWSPITYPIITLSPSKINFKFTLFCDLFFKIRFTHAWDKKLGPSFGGPKFFLLCSESTLFVRPITFLCYEWSIGLDNSIIRCQTFGKARLANVKVEMYCGCHHKLFTKKNFRDLLYREFFHFSVRRLD